MIVDVSGTDTLKIQKFDENGRLVFWKSFPQYGASQILTYTYIKNKLTIKNKNNLFLWTRRWREG